MIVQLGTASTAIAALIALDASNAHIPAPRNDDHPITVPIQ